MNNWKQITITTTAEGADLIADILFGVSMDGVTIKDKNDIAELYKSSIVWDYIDENALKGYDGRVYVSGVTAAENINQVISQIQSQIDLLKSRTPFNIGAAEIIVCDLEDTDWRNEWKKYYKPIKTKSVTVVPVWLKYQKAYDERVLIINPGMAFGTGEHETTKLCLDLLGGLDVNGKRVIDVGTGSGILGIAAVLSGAKSAYMCDIDADALVIARENAELNKVTDKCDIACDDLLQKEGIIGDIIFANITADILIKLSHSIDKYLAKDGIIILSGIIHERKKEVECAFTEKNFEIIKDLKLGEWNALMIKHK